MDTLERAVKQASGVPKEVPLITLNKILIFVQLGGYMHAGCYAPRVLCSRPPCREEAPSPPPASVF